MDEFEKRRILLVDDEEAILLAFRKILETPAVEVNTATSAEEARRLLNERPYRAVIADLRMSGAAIMDGYVVVSEAKRRQPNAKIVVITAYGAAHIKQRVLDLGADMYLEKPVSPTEVKELLTSMGVY
jgi:CheY-like chemotaxis protein